MQCFGGEGGYPVWIEEIAKADTFYRNVDEIVAALQARVARHAQASWIGVCDHYGLNLRLGERLPAAMQDARIALLCDAPALSGTAFLALQPCAIGVADMGNRFVFSFMERPDAAGNGFLRQWLDGMRVG
jgi:hypothetical protein